MRIYFSTTPNRETVGFDYQAKMISRLHVWLGKDNVEHDELSLYSFSNLTGGYAHAGKLHFENGAHFFFAAHSADVIERVISATRKDPNLVNGMKIQEIVIADRLEPESNRIYCYAASPILVKQWREAGQWNHLTWDNPACDEIMTNLMKKKMAKAGIEGDIKIRFDRDYAKAKTKLIDIHGIKSKANICPVILESDSPDVLRFTYDAGIGHGTGSGFGAVRR